MTGMSFAGIAARGLFAVLGMATVSADLARGGGDRGQGESENQEFHGPRFYSGCPGN